MREGGREGREACWPFFHLDISQILPMCVFATAMTTFMEMVHEFICIYLLSFVCVYTCPFQCVRVYVSIVLPV